MLHRGKRRRLRGSQRGKVFMAEIHRVENDWWKINVTFTVGKNSIV